MDAVIVAGRILFGGFFLLMGAMHFMSLQDMTAYATSKAVPQARVAVMVAGLMLIAGGLSILVWSGVWLGAILLIVFLLAANLKMHNFWAIEDRAQGMVEMTQFMKNVALAGAALALWYLEQESGVEMPFSVR